VLINPTKSQFKSHHPFYDSMNLMLSYHLCLGVQSDFPPFKFSDGNFLCISYLLHVCYISHLLPWFKIANNVWWKVIIMSLLIVQLSQAFHFLPLRSKYFPQYSILQRIFKKQYQNLDLCIKYDLLYYVITTIQGGVFLHLKPGNQKGNSDSPCTNKKEKTTNIWNPSTLRSLINR
jgi:hypothetical protein